MKDREISATCVVAYGAWAMTVALMVTGVVFNRSDVRAISLMFCGIAMTATIRGYLINMGCQMRNAFELGRDSVAPLFRR